MLQGWLGCHSLIKIHKRDKACDKYQKQYSLLKRQNFKRTLKYKRGNNEVPKGGCEITPPPSRTFQQVLEKIALPKSNNISIQLTTAQNLQVLRVPLVVRKNIHLLHNRPRLLIKKHEKLPCKAKCASLVCILLLFFHSHVEHNKTKASSSKI